MKEIKFLIHLPRNAFLLFLYYAALNIAGNFTTNLNTLLAGGVAISLVYAPVYFINDFFDQHEDKKLGKHNLFNTINSSRLFWILSAILFFSGCILSFSINPQTIWPIGILYILNGIYSAPPFRFRSKPFYRELNLLLIYAVKSILLLQYIHYPLNKLSVLLLVLLSITSAYSLTVYKRHLAASKTAEYLFGTIFYLFLGVVFYHYPKLIPLLIPTVPLSLYLVVTNKNKHVRLGMYELIYLVWSIVVFVIMKK